MEKKNTMLLTVIAVATLLVAVVGATFAYYSVTSDTKTSSTTNLNTTTQKVGTVSLTTTQSNLYLHVTAEQMSKVNAGKSFYSTTTIADAATAVPNPQPTLATFELTGASQGDVYRCTFNYSLTTTSSSTNYANLTAEDGSVTITADSVVTGIPANTSLFATKGTGVTGTNGVVTLTAGADGTATALVKGYAQWNNLNDEGDQNRVADLNMNTVLNLSGLSCDTVARS